MSERPVFEGWAILELMGHRRLGGYVSEATIAGVGFIRIEIVAEKPIDCATQFYSPGAVYALTPTTEAMARAVAAHNAPQPVHRWELAQLPAASAATRADVVKETCFHVWHESPDDGECPACGDVAVPL